MDRLYRSRQDRMLAGVAGGLAELWDADPSLVRVLWALLVVFTGGIALVVYIIMAIVVPDEDEVRPAGSTGGATGGAAAAPGTGATAGAAGGAAPIAGEGWTQPRADVRAARREARTARRAANGDSAFPAAAVAGGILILLGGFFLAREFLPSIDFDLVWPIVLIVVGAFLIVTAMRRPSDPGS